jgi:hypothetical protein
METLDKHFRQLLGPAFQKHGFAQQELLSRWPQIVGDAIAALASPERIRWPRTAISGPMSGGTLHVKAVAGRGLEVQYAVPAMLDRINQFLGYQALTAIKVVQGHEAAQPPSVQPLEPAPISPDVARKIAAIENPALQESLARLAEGIARDTSRPSSTRSPQAK